MTQACQQFREAIETSSLNLPGDLTYNDLDQDLQQHLQECAACREEIAHLQQSWLLLSANLPPAHVSQDFEDRVMARIQDTPQPSRRYSPRQTVWKYALAASLLLVMLTGTLLKLGPLRFVGQQSGDDDMAAIRSIAAQVEKLKELEHLFAVPATLNYVSLPGEPNQPICFLVQDAISEEVHFLASNLEAGPGTNLWLWLLADDGNILSSAEVVHQHDTATGSAILSAVPNIETILITEESSGTTPKSPSSEQRLRRQVTFR